MEHVAIVVLILLGAAFTKLAVMTDKRTRIKRPYSRRSLWR